MENSTITPQIEFKNLVANNLIYEKISKISFEDYKKFVVSFFTQLDAIRNRGLKKIDTDHIIRKQYSDVISAFDDNDVMFERRFEVFNEEILEFCLSPHFWKTDFDIYMKKWERAFLSSWFKEI